jgi:hypothetical protein
MGRKTEFSDQQIIDSGLAIEREGKSVSPFAIRNRLGGGSSERIKNVWLTFDENRPSDIEEESSQDKIDLPIEVQDILEKNIDTATQMFTKLASEGYKIAQLIAENRVKSTVEDYQSKIADSIESEHQASLAIEESDRRIDVLEIELDISKSKADELLADNAKKDGIVESLRERLLVLERKEEEFNNLQREHGKLEERLKHFNNLKNDSK